MTCCPFSKTTVGLTVAAAAVMVGLFGFNRSASYLTTGWNKLAAVAKDQVSPEFELDRIRTQLDALSPDIETAKSRVAEAKVDLDALDKRLSEGRTALTAKKAELQSLTEAVETKAARVSLNGRSFSFDSAKAKLARDLSGYELAEKELATRQRLYDAKAKGYEAAREQLANMRRQQDELTVVVAQLEAELKEARLAETNASVPLDDSRLADIKQSISDVRRQVEVMKAKQALDENLDGTPVEPTTDELIRRAKEKVGEPAKDAVRVD